MQIRARLLSAATSQANKRNFTSKRIFFEEQLKTLHLETSTKFIRGNSKYRYLFEETGREIVTRLLDINKVFPEVLEINKRTEDIKSLIFSKRELLEMRHFSERKVNELNEENETFDLVVSNLSLHWENDLHGAFKEINRVLKPDGVFIGAIFSEDTLHQLKSSLMIAEQEREGGISQRVSPFISSADLCVLLSGAEFAIPTVDKIVINVEYEDMFELADHLQKMGESNAVKLRRTILNRDTALAAATIYQHLFNSFEEKLKIIAEFDISFFIGWKKIGKQ